MGLFVGVYGVIGGRLVSAASRRPKARRPTAPTTRSWRLARDLLDRNGEVLATDIRTASLFAEPRRIIDPDEASELLLGVMPDLDLKWLYRRLSPAMPASSGCAAS